ncbi:type I methionyl aminopeptidase [Planctomycetota bacterium]|nr:type I methionyl aminopeptidase [Planctomycetota bacterium]
MAINLKTKKDIEKMRVAGRIVKNIHHRIEELCKPGVSLLELDEEVGRLVKDAGARNLFLNYPTYRSGEGFPRNACISINDVVVHGIADETPVKDGDIVSLDVGVQIDGWCGDAAVTILVGNVAPETRQLCEDTEHILNLAISEMRPGRKWSQIARMMQRYAEKKGYGVVQDFVGHGIGRQMHEDPKVPNYVSRDLVRHDIDLREGLVLAVEPMCNLGTKEVKTLRDGWTVVTLDGKPSAHYEHTVAITKDGAVPLTDGN